MFRPSWPSSSSTSKSPKIAKRHAMMAAWPYIRTYWCIKSIAWIHSKQDSNDNIRRPYSLCTMLRERRWRLAQLHFLQSLNMFHASKTHRLPTIPPFLHIECPIRLPHNEGLLHWFFKDSHQNRTRSYGADISDVTNGAYESYESMSLMSLWVLWVYEYFMVNHKNIKLLSSCSRSAF